ncbi:SDR family NAD(P)-dependent oxidoreductase [Pseudomonas paeninsulae]|uniref:SDR family NAD(P)-dependent oxidoreductase n=1 Tax=Pseudomonas paeninsulae TaxID=3110772 RepID=UPI002D79A6A3|nr:SDR family NAD(P)-dependent oxidoreductase [Pseudomonas sp. IT1137]
MSNNEASAVVITGASSGIGRALALEMAHRGHPLSLTARRFPLLEQLREEIHRDINAQLTVQLAVLDVCQIDSVGETLRDLFTRLWGVGTVVVNASANDLTRVGGDSLDKELNLIPANLTGAIATVNAAAAHFLVRGQGNIVGISSLASLQPLNQQAAYCASKVLPSPISCPASSTPT